MTTQQVQISSERVSKFRTPHSVNGLFYIDGCKDDSKGNPDHSQRANDSPGSQSSDHLQPYPQKEKCQHRITVIGEALSLRYIRRYAEEDSGDEQFAFPIPPVALDHGDR